MSHEVRTPLNAIIGFSEIVHDELMAPLASANKEFVAEILNSSRHLLRLIDEILDLARLEAGRMDFTSEDFDLTEVCQEVIASLYPLLATKHLSTNVDVDPDAQHARMDGHRLRQVLYKPFKCREIHPGRRVHHSPGPPCRGEPRSNRGRRQRHWHRGRSAAETIPSVSAARQQHEQTTTGHRSWTGLDEADRGGPGREPWSQEHTRPGQPIFCRAAQVPIVTARP
jgi:His Kinase A (phospho-acceptor) domain